MQSKPHTYAVNGGMMRYNQETQIERPGGADNTPDLATKG